MAPNFLPSELLFEIAPFVPAHCSVPTIFSSCQLLRNLLLPRVLKWKERKQQLATMEMDDSLSTVKVEPIELERALSLGVLDPISGVFSFRGFVQEPISLRDALNRGLIKFSNAQPRIGLSLAQCISQQFIGKDETDNKFVDNATGETFTLVEAVHCQPYPLINNGVKECLNTTTGRRISVAEAEIVNILDLNTGKFTNLNSREEISLSKAWRENLIRKQMTLMEASLSGVLDARGNKQFNDHGTKRTFLEAIAFGMLDPDVKQIKSANGIEWLSIVEALKDGRLLPEGRLVLTDAERPNHPSREINFNLAQRWGLLSGSIRHTIYDVKGIKIVNGEKLSFKEAVRRGVYNLQNEALEHQLRDESTRRLIGPKLADILTAPCGLVANGVEISLVRAYAIGRVNSFNGTVVDPVTNTEMHVGRAYLAGNTFTSLRAAMRMAALLNLHHSL
ncbi:hypothetical protein niasHT_033762 [Heterodera trifolii]|uniref:F-box domain-containing protein n=1 Tax=Heterodera trifolii TaxID=157864 RepID=A0ABD2IY60_9BILA